MHIWCLFGAETSPGELVCASHVLYYAATYEAPLKFLYCVFFSCPPCCVYSSILKRRVLFGLQLESSRSVVLVPSPAAMSMCGPGHVCYHWFST